FDKPNRMTVSGVRRGEQRRRYDLRRSELIPQHGLQLWVITPTDVGGDRRGRLSAREHGRDLMLLRSAWERALGDGAEIRDMVARASDHGRLARNCESLRLKASDQTVTSSDLQDLARSEGLEPPTF